MDDQHMKDTEADVADEHAKDAPEKVGGEHNAAGEANGDIEGAHNETPKEKEGGVL